VKFSCPKCETKYSIADEKVRGKVLKIRCKKCENVITLREQPAAEAQPPPEEPTRAVAMDPAMLAGLRQTLEAPQPRKETATSRAQAAPARAATQVPQRQATATVRAEHPTAGAHALAPSPLSSPEWFLAIKGQQAGPMGAEDVRAKLLSGEAELRTYAWCEGMGDWKRLSDIPEFRAPSRPPPPPLPPPPPVESDEHAGGQVLDLQAEIARRQKRPVLEPAEAPAPTPRSAADPFGQMLADKAEPHGNAPSSAAQDPFAAVPDSAAAAVEGPPRESTRMFIAAAGLANRARKHRVYALVGTVVASALGTVVYLDASGIYQIPIVTQLVDISFAAVGAEPPVRKRVVDPEEESEWDFTGLNKVKRARTATRRVHPSGGPNFGEDIDLKGAMAGAQGGASNVLNERVGDGTAADVAMPSSDPTRSAEIGDMLKGRTQIAVNADLQKKNGAQVNTGLLNEKNRNVDVPLKPEQIAKVVSDQKSSLTSCANDAAKAGEKFRGTLKVSVAIMPSGKVKSVAVNDIKQKETVLGQCLGRALMRWIFPPFKGEAFDAELPLKMAVGP
jgi:predicted Zn finger-like uncharacterized protein